MFDPKDFEGGTIRVGILGGRVPEPKPTVATTIAERLYGQAPAKPAETPPPDPLWSRLYPASK